MVIFTQLCKGLRGNGQDVLILNKGMHAEAASSGAQCHSAFIHAAQQFELPPVGQAQFRAVGHIGGGSLRHGQSLTVRIPR
jgi:hypothetical protein